MVVEKKSHGNLETIIGFLYASHISMIILVEYKEICVLNVVRRLKILYGPLAQLYRASVFETEGRGLESYRDHQ